MHTTNRQAADELLAKINEAVRFYRLLALVERSKIARTSNGRELVVIKDAAIKAFMKDQGIHLRTCSGYSPSNVDAAAHAAGRAAGDRATFGRPVTGAAGVLRIGK